MKTNSAALRRLEDRCKRSGLKITAQRRLILEVLHRADDHPSVDDIHERVRRSDPRISMATVYRTLNLLEGAGIIERRQFDGLRTQYELAGDAPHDHLIDLESGKVIEFQDDAFDALKAEIAARFGYRFSEARVEIYAKPIDRQESTG